MRWTSLCKTLFFSSANGQQGPQIVCPESVDVGQICDMKASKIQDSEKERVAGGEQSNGMVQTMSDRSRKFV